MASNLATLLEVTRLLAKLAGSRVLGEASGIDRYSLNLRGPVRALWNHQIGQQQAYEMLFTAIEGGLRNAFYEGAEAMGVKPNEFKPNENAELDRIIRAELGHLDGFMDNILADIEAGKKLGELFGRLRLWYNRYTDTVNRAKVVVGADQKLKWVVAFGKEHCRTCLSLHNKVKRASTWAASGLRPQSPPNDKLE